ncbi:MAG: NUDIX hydrolase [Rhodospirillales bacterium]|nr:NUDIX hydrolase [Rhodospirillales bacterium]
MSRLYPKRPIVGVGVVVLRGDQVLLVRRAKPPRQGSWSLPGGAQKIGETVFEAGRREVLEETGVTVEVRGLLDVVDSIQPDDMKRIRFHFTLVDVLAVWISGEARAATDAEEAAWFARAAVPGLGLWSETERMIRLGFERRAALSD